MSVKILHVIDHLAFGGAQTALKSVIENIDQDHFESLICALRQRSKIVLINANIITLNHSKWDFCGMLALLKLCRERKIDIIHAHLQKAIFSCLIINLFCKIPIIIHEHGAIFRKGLFFSIYRLILRILHRRAAVIIANSQTTAHELAKKTATKQDRIKVIYNPVDFNIFNYDKVSRNKSRSDLGISNDDFVIGFVGRLHPVKGPDILVKAFSLLFRQSGRCLLVLAGDGPQRKHLETLTTQLRIAHRVRFLGMRSDIPEVMGAFDVSVVPSRFESFGIVAVELMRIKIPIVASGKSGLAELIEDQVTGLITHENKPEEICTCIQKLAEDKNLRNQLAEAAYAFSEKFGAQEQVKQIERLYAEVHNKDKN